MMAIMMAKEILQSTRQLREDIDNHIMIGEAGRCNI
jgi:hypothetical protein